MSDNLKSIGESGLRCFGAISASISHELKNALAIINENAGLLEDLSLMAGKGLPLDPVRLKNLAANIGKQIHRADGIIRNMNRFAHSVDETVRSIDLADTLSLIVAVSSRLAAMKGVSLNFIPPPETVCAATHVFFFQNLIWLCLREMIESPSREKEIAISVGLDPEGVAVVFSPVNVPMTDGRTLDLLCYLKAKQAVDADLGKLRIVLPNETAAG